MSLSNSVLRRYTPPTCTLEISATQSPLSRWAGRPVLKHLRFQLSLDDPRTPEDKWVTLRGDRSQLEALTEAVTRYVQQFINQSAATGSLPGLRYNGSDALLVAPELPGRTAVLSPSPELDASYTPQFSQKSLAASSGESRAPAPTLSKGAKIYLTSVGLLCHHLFLGPLANEDTGPMLSLTTLQLFDLATALDEYAADALTLPSLERPSWLQASPAWAKVAAVALVALGLSAPLLRLVDGPRSATSPTSSQGASSADQQAALPPLPNPSVAVSPTMPPLGSQQPLPPPPPPGSTVPGNSKLTTVPVPGAAPVGPIVSQAPPPPPAGSIANGDSRQINIPTQPTLQGETTVAQIPAPASRARTQASQAASLRAAESRGQDEAAPPAANSSGGTAFDTIPQVAQARSFFLQRWKPTEGLSQTLEYSVILAPDGSIQRIIPLGQAAGDFLDRTGMPLVGEPFVAPPKPGQAPRIRIVLEPDGKVRTFLESPN